MPTYRITYRPDLHREPETVQADWVSNHSALHVVLHSTMLVMGRPRDIVVRRIARSAVLSVDLTTD